MHEAARVVQAVRDVDVYIEQPCRTYEECLTVRRRTALPFILDENIDGMRHPAARHRRRRHGRHQSQDLQGRRPHAGAGDARSLRLRRRRHDHRGHLGRRHRRPPPSPISPSSTPAEFLFSATDFNSYVTRSIAKGAPQRKAGRMTAPDGPGLGLEPRLDVLGKPVLAVGKPKVTLSCSYLLPPRKRGPREDGRSATLDPRFRGESKGSDSFGSDCCGGSVLAELHREQGRSATQSLLTPCCQEGSL